MSNEMDAMDMDERQRINWLKANRLTLIVVGLVWLGMIAFELVNSRTPVFMIAMVPVIALVRFAAYKLYIRRI